MLLLVGAIAVFYVWMIRAFDDRVALLASLLIVVTDLVWQFAISGLNVPLLLLLVSGMGAAWNEALRAEEDEADVWALVWIGVAAVLGALAFLTRYSMMAFPLALMFGAAFSFRQRIPALVITVLVPLLIAAPWLLRNMQLTGNPFGFAWVGIYAFDSVLWRTFGEHPAAYMGLKQLVKAVVFGLGNQLENMGYFFGGFLLPGVFFASLLHTFRNSATQMSRWVWLIAAVLLVLFNASVIKQADPQVFLELNGLIVLIPILAAYSAAFLYTLMDRLKLPSNILQIPLVVLIVGLQLIPLGIKVVQKTPPRFAYPPYFPPVLFFIKDWLEPTELKSADIPWATAWYCDRVSLWIPHRKKDFYELNDFKFRISAMLFTPETSNRKMLTQIQMGEYAEWAPLIKRTKLEDLPLPFVTALPPNPEQDYLYFSDRVRWK
ncbi:MAG: glycosyltransferase family 39 protein [Blastochloris sp.]|nr:glycosyltransferase family 39 protein [Blastochloris sp.]